VLSFQGDAAVLQKKAQLQLVTLLLNLMVSRLKTQVICRYGRHEPINDKATLKFSDKVKKTITSAMDYYPNRLIK